jgi:hypothetical protein
MPVSRTIDPRSMLTSLARLCGAVLTVALMISRPFLLWMAARKRRAGAWRQRPPVPREHDDTRPEPAIRALQATADVTSAMADEMRRVLDEDESHRQVYRHLARFERKFAKYGLRTIEQFPVDHLRRALGDFEALVRNWSSPGLADLRSRMAVVLADRSSAASLWIAANSVSRVGRSGSESMAGRLARNAGTAFRSSRQCGTRHLGMSRFELGDRGFSSTSAPA